MSSDILVHLDGFDVCYDVHVPSALSGATLTVRRGDRLVVIGESGSGKTTLALSAAGLLPESAITTGRIEWPAFGVRPRPGRDVGYVFQEPSGSLDPVMRIGVQIAEVMLAHGLPDRSAARISAIDLLSQVDLPDPASIAEAFPHQLSGGQRQRVALALALAGGPRLLIADEVTSALDPVVQAKIVELVAKLCRKRDVTLILVTHDIALAAGLGTRLAVVYSARIVEVGQTAQILEAPRHPYTKALLATHIGLERSRGIRIPVIDGQPPDLAFPLSGCRFAPRCGSAVRECSSAEPAWRGPADNGAACIRIDREPQ